MAELRIHNITVSRSGKLIVDRASLGVGAGQFVVLLGPNGSGKTSLLRTTLGLARPDSGEAFIDAHPLAAIKPAERARLCAYLPQMRPLAWPMRVRDVVALGRFAFGAKPGRLSAEDERAAAQALASCDLTHLQDRAADTLSGGELSRMHLARALAAQAPILIADEPTAGLDPRHAWTACQVIADFVRNGGAALVVLHDLALAARFATQIAIMHRGIIVSIAPPEEALTALTLRQTYGVDMAFSDVDGVRTPVIHGLV